MTAEPAPSRGWRITRADRPAIWWAIACCWLAVFGNYALLELGLRAAYIVPFDLFVVPLAVTLVFRLFRRRSAAP
jgi:hypothetical protein